MSFPIKLFMLFMIMFPVELISVFLFTEAYLLKITSLKYGAK
jgi:hypothetical protein